MNARGGIKPDPRKTHRSFARSERIKNRDPHLIHTDQLHLQFACDYYCVLFESDSMILCISSGSSTTFVPSHLAFEVNSEHRLLISMFASWTVSLGPAQSPNDSNPQTLTLGLLVIVLHALKTSTFLSFFSVLGNLEPAHETIIPMSCSIFCTLAGANGDSPASAIF